MAGASSQSLVLCDLIAPHMLKAAMAIVHAEVLPCVNLDVSLAGLKVT